MVEPKGCFDACGSVLVHAGRGGHLPGGGEFGAFPAWGLGRYRLAPPARWVGEASLTCFHIPELYREGADGGSTPEEPGDGIVTRAFPTK